MDIKTVPPEIVVIAIGAAILVAWIAVSLKVITIIFNMPLGAKSKKKDYNNSQDIDR